MITSKITSETNVKVIFDVVLLNAQELFPGATGRQNLMRCPGCSSIVINLPIEYRERDLTLDTDLDPNDLGVVVKWNHAIGNHIGDHVSKPKKLLDLLMKGLSEPTTQSDVVNSKSIFDNL